MGSEEKAKFERVLLTLSIKKKTLPDECNETYRHKGRKIKVVKRKKY